VRKIIIASVTMIGLLIYGGIASADPSAADNSGSQPAAGALAQPAVGATATTPTTTTTTAATAGQTASTADDPDLNRIVCRQGTAPTGSRLGGARECHSKREWDRLQTEQQQELSRQQIGRGIGGGN
jgi:hypothetical protein